MKAWPFETVTLIPFDLGRPLSAGEVLGQLDEAFSREERMPIHRSLAGATIYSGVTEVGPGDRIECDVFDDGVGVLTVRRNGSKSFESASRDLARVFLQERRDMHHQLLDSAETLLAPATAAINRLRDDLRRAGHAVRRSAAAEWERRGYSYAFTLFLLEGAGWNDDGFLFHLAEPSVTGIEDTPLKADPGEGRVVDEDGGGVVKIMTATPERLRALDVDMHERTVGLITWSTVVALGARQKREGYVYLEKRLQHFWFFSYVLMQEVRTYLDRAQRHTLRELEAMRMGIGIALYELGNVSDTSIPSRDQILLAEMVKTSHLEQNINSLTRLLDLVEAQVTSRQRSRSETTQRVFTVLLAIIALFQAYPRVEAVFGTVAAWAVSGAIIVVVAGVLVWEHWRYDSR